MATTVDTVQQTEKMWWRAVCQDMQGGDLTDSNLV